MNNRPNRVIDAPSEGTQLDRTTEYEKIYGTDLPVVIDEISKRIKREHNFSELTEFLRYAKSKNQFNKIIFIYELDKALPDWRDKTSAKDPEKYILSNKLPYRAKKFF